MPSAWLKQKCGVDIEREVADTIFPSELEVITGLDADRYRSLFASAVTTSGQ